MYYTIKLRSSLSTTSNYDRRGEDAKKQAVDLLRVPIQKPSVSKISKKKSKDSKNRCPNCKSVELRKDGFQILADGKQHQRYRCVKCEYAFTPLLSVND